MKRVWKVIQDSGNSQTESDIVGWEVWPDGSLLRLEDGTHLQMVAALNGAGLWPAGGVRSDVLQQCLVRPLEASLASRHERRRRRG